MTNLLSYSVLNTHCPSNCFDIGYPKKATKLIRHIGMQPHDRAQIFFGCKSGTSSPLQHKWKFSH